MSTIEDFFQAYAIASLNENADQVAKFYDRTFIVATKNESSAFSNDQKFIAWLNGVFDFNRKAGLMRMAVKNVDSFSIGECFAKATVTWSAVFSKKPEEEIYFDLHYILRRDDEHFKINLYISEENQQELMQKNGVL